MRTFVKNSLAARQTRLPESLKPGRPFFGQGYGTNSFFRAPRVIENQALSTPLGATTKNVGARLPRVSSANGFAYEFVEIPIKANERASLQPKHKVDVSRDRCEQEADRVAGEVLQRKIPGEESERLEIKEKASSQPAVGEPQVQGEVERQLDHGKNSGSPISNDVRAFIEPRFQLDFSRVRVHANEESALMNQKLRSKAFTHGQDIYFGDGQYNPQANSGKWLLAHELAHVAQQRGGPSRINLFPNPAAPPDPYLPGRPAHNHPALGNWPAVQANARSVCARETMVVIPPLPLPPVPIPVPTSIRGRSECACAVMTPMQVMGLARTIEMHDKPLAVLHLNHYISGGGADYIEHTNLDNLMTSDAGARGVVARAIGGADRGQVFIQQSDYSNQDFRYAFGGIDRVDYRVDRAAGMVDVWFKDRYDFHPAGFGHVNKGAGDSAPPGRVTNCVHLAAVEAKSSGAADYWMLGHATLPLSLFTTHSAPSSPSGTTT